MNIDTNLVKELLTIAHLLGVALGAGGAFVSDFLFASSIKDKSFSRTEIRFLNLGGKIVWLGLITLVISGIGLFSLDPAKYLESSKFLAKMAIVAIITLNGIVFHLSHIPRIIRHAGEHFPSSDEFIRKRHLLLISGAISGTSWISALILGSLRTIPYSFGTIMSIYVVVVSTAILVALLLRQRMLPHHRTRK